MAQHACPELYLRKRTVRLQATGKPPGGPREAPREAPGGTREAPGKPPEGSKMAKFAYVHSVAKQNMKMLKKTMFF